MSSLGTFPRVWDLFALRTNTVQNVELQYEKRRRLCIFTDGADPERHEYQEAFCFQRGYDCLPFPLRQRRNTSKHKLISDDANDFVESKTEAKVKIPELGTYSCFKEVADSPSVLSRGRPRNEMGYSYILGFVERIRCLREDKFPLNTILQSLFHQWR